MKLRLFILFLFVTKFSWAFPLTDSRNLALGGVVVAGTSIESALFINPAELSEANGLRTAFTQTRLSFSDFDFGISASFPLFKNQVGIGMGWDAVAARNQLLTGFVRDSNGQYVIDPGTGMPQTQVLGFFTQNTNQFYLSSGIRIGFLSLGASFKYFLSDFGGTEGMGMGFDFAAQARFSDDLLWGGTLFDLGESHVRYNDGTPDLVFPLAWASSLSWTFLQNSEFSVMAEPGVYKDAGDGLNDHWGGGLEGAWKKNVFLRVGINQDRLSLGVGLVAHPEKIFQEIRVDYAYLNHSPDGYPSRLTLSVAW